jgi:hypothetical protein
LETVTIKYNRDINVLTDHIVIHKGLAKTIRLVINTWTQYGTEDFLARTMRNGSKRKYLFFMDPDPDG